MATKIKTFPVDMFVDDQEGTSIERRMQVELFERMGGDSLPEEIRKGALAIQPYTEGAPMPDCLEITEMQYVEGRATFKASVKEEFIERDDFYSIIREPILYEIVARPKGEGALRRKPDPVKRLLDIRIGVASIHWNWWVISKDYLPKVAPPDAQSDTPIKLDPDGEGGFCLDLWVREFNPLTGGFEEKRGEHDFSHMLAPGDGAVSFEEVAMDPLPWDSEDPKQGFTNWWSVRGLREPGGNFELPLSTSIQVNAYPKGGIKRRKPEPPFMEAGAPKVASREIDLELENFEFALWEIDGQKPESVVPLAAAAGEIPREGYRLTLKLFNGEEPAGGIKVRVSTWDGGDTGWEPLGKILEGGDREIMTRADGTFEFVYKPNPMELKQDYFESGRGLEERFDIIARRHERCKGHKARDRGKGWKKRKAGASLGISLDPEVTLRFCKRPYILRESQGGDRPAPYEMVLKKELEEAERAKLRQIIYRGGELHLQARIASQEAEGAKICDGSWFLEPKKEGKPGKSAEWLDGGVKDVCALRFPDTGHPEGPVSEPLVFEKKGGFGLIDPIESQMKLIEKRASQLDEALGTKEISAGARRFVKSCVEKIGRHGEAELEKEAESFLETIVTVPYFLGNTKLSKEALDASIELHGEASRRFRESTAAAFLEILGFGPVRAGIEKISKGSGKSAAAGLIPDLIGEFRERGRESALRFAKTRARDLPVGAYESARALVAEEIKTVKAESVP